MKESAGESELRERRGGCWLASVDLVVAAHWPCRACGAVLSPKKSSLAKIRLSKSIERRNFMVFSWWASRVVGSRVVHFANHGMKSRKHALLGH